MNLRQVKLRSIQALRGVAAMGVVVHHAFPGRAPMGAAGVDLFFVISGFIMASCATGRTPTEFLADRAWRIYPLWLIALAPWFLITPESPLEVVRSITLWPVFGNQFLNPALGVGWTLSFELVFYLCFALALATRPVVPIVLYGLCLFFGFRGGSVLLWFLGSPLAFEFLLGVAVTRLRPMPHAGAAMICAGLLWFVLVPGTYFEAAFGQAAIDRVLAWGVPAAMILYGAWSLEDRLAGKAFALPVLLGSASYSIYLFHPLIFLWMPGVAGLLLTPVAGVAAYYTVERSIMRSKPRWGGKRGGPSQPSVATQSGASASVRT